MKIMRQRKYLFLVKICFYVTVGLGFLKYLYILMEMKPRSMSRQAESMASSTHVITMGWLSEMVSAMSLG